MDRKLAKLPAADLNPAGEPEGSAPRVGILVAIGGSAGALEPLQRFFEYMPSDSGMAFVVVQHLERHHPSLLAELLARHTKMPVKQVQSGTLPQPNHVYIIAPNTFLTLRRGLLQVGAIEAPGARKPIDAFMTSLAENLDEGAIGIILSGTGADGTIGMRAIKEHGGFTLAQSPETAKFEDMPNSVITAGLADHALRVEDMPAQLLSYAERVVQLRQREARSLDDELNALLGPICDALQKHTGHDFSQYKKGTLLRRVGRRVRLQDSISVADYLRRLRRAPPRLSCYSGIC